MTVVSATAATCVPIGTVAERFERDRAEDDRDEAGAGREPAELERVGGGHRRGGCGTDRECGPDHHDEDDDQSSVSHGSHR